MVRRQTPGAALVAHRRSGPACRMLRDRAEMTKVRRTDSSPFAVGQRRSLARPEPPPRHLEGRHHCLGDRAGAHPGPGRSAVLPGRPAGTVVAGPALAVAVHALVPGAGMDQPAWPGGTGGGLALRRIRPGTGTGARAPVPLAQINDLLAPARISTNNMTRLPRWLSRRARSFTAAVAGDGGREVARDNFGLLPWTSAADRVRCRRMPPRCRSI
jgi:hypothetical protein